MEARLPEQTRLLSVRRAGDSSGRHTCHAAFSADGAALVTATGCSDSGYTFCTWDTANGRRQFHLPGVPAITCVAFGPKGQRFVGGMADRTLRLWDAGGKQHTTAHHDAVAWVAFDDAESGLSVLTGSGDCSFARWDATTGLAFGNRAYTGWAVRMGERSPDGRFVATLSDDDAEAEHVAVFETATWRLLTKLAHTGNAESLAWSADSEVLLVGTSLRWHYLWDATAGFRRIAYRYEHDASVTGAAFAPDGTWYIAASADMLIRRYVWRGGEDMKENTAARIDAHDAPITALALNPAGTVAASGDAAGTVKLWDVSSAASGHACTATIQCHATPVRRLRFAKDGDAVACVGEEGGVCIVAVPSGEAITTVSHTERVVDVDWSGDGRFLVTGSYDNSWRLWTAHAAPNVATVRRSGRLRNARVVHGCLVTVDEYTEFLHPPRWITVAFSVISDDEEVSLTPLPAVPPEGGASPPPDASLRVWCAGNALYARVAPRATAFAATVVVTAQHEQLRLEAPVSGRVTATKADVPGMLWCLKEGGSS